MLRIGGSGFRSGAAVAVAMVLVLAACAGGSDDSEAEFDPTNPDGTEALVPGTAVQLDDDVIIATDDGSIPTPTTDPAVDPNGPDAVPAAPTAPAAPVALPAPDAVGRIVSLSPTHTETLYALGLGDFVVAVDTESDFPAEVVAKQLVGFSAASADLTALLALKPDIVIVGDDPTGMVGRLNAAGVASYSGPPATSLADVYTQINDVAALVGRPDLAEDLVASMQADVAEIVASLPSGQRTYFHEIDPSLVTVTPGTFLDSVYGELGLVSIVGQSDPSGVAQLSPDQVVSANPDVIVLADAECCAVTIDVIAGRPGWSSISAVENGAVVAVPEALLSRWGPRVVELLRTVGGGVAAAG